MSTFDGTVLGLLAAVLLGIGAAAWKGAAVVWAYVTSPTGPIERIAATHAEFVSESVASQHKLTQCLERHEDATAAHFHAADATASQVASLVAAAHRACDVLDVVRKRYGLNGEIEAMIRQIRSELSAAARDGE